MKPLEFGGEEMYVIVAYDVDQKRCNKVLKYLRQWLEHRQRSLLSGFLSERQLKTMQNGLLKIIEPNYDSVIIFKSNKATQVGEWCTQAADMQRLNSVILPSGIQRTKKEQRIEQEGHNDVVDKKDKKPPGINFRM